RTRGQRPGHDRVAVRGIVDVVPVPGRPGRNAVPVEPGAAVDADPERVVGGRRRDDTAPDLVRSGRRHVEGDGDLAVRGRCRRRVVAGRHLDVLAVRGGRIRKL